MTAYQFAAAAGCAGALLLGIALALECGKADSLRAELASAQGELATAQANLALREKEKAALEAALAQNKRTAEEMAAGRRELEAKLKAIGKASKPVREWAGAPVPGDVARLLREGAGSH